MKRLLLFFSLLLISLHSFSAEVVSCEISDTSPSFLSHSLHQSHEGRIYIADKQTQQDLKIFFNSTKQSCENLSWFDKEATILAAHLAAAGVTCSQSGHPAARTAGLVISILGVGIQYIKITYSDELQACDKLKREEEVKNMMKRYLESQGAKVK